MSARIVFVSFLLISFIASISTQFSTIFSIYSSELTTNSPTYTRDGATGLYYYYRAVEVRVNTTGVYTFTSSSSISNTYGYLYQGNFYPTYPSYNIVARDDDSGGNGQFQMTMTLRSDLTYILVFTTYREQEIGSFSIVASGPDNVFNPLVISQTTTSTGVTNACPLNEVSFENHCYYLDGIGGQCANGYSLGSETVLSQIAQSFTGLDYKTATSDNCCVITTAQYSNYGMGGSGQCNTAGPLRGGPSLNGGGCRNYAGKSAKQLTFCASD